MAPLYAAMMHGCRAGRYEEALSEVYWKRILRGNEHFSWKKLGTFGADLAAISGFFEDTSWRKPVNRLNANAKGFTLNQAGLYLRSLGRLVESEQSMQAGLEARIAQENWVNAARNAGNLSEIYLTLGNVKAALAYAEQSVRLADKSGDDFERLGNRSTLGDALHQVGRLEESQAAFHEAEEMQRKRQPELPILYALQGIQYCDTLLSQANYEEVQSRANKMLEWTKQVTGVSLLSYGIIYLALGRAHLLQSQREPNHPFTESANYLNRAVDGLRQAGAQEFIVRGLLARAEYYRVTGDLDKAGKDLNEAFTIASRGGMGLHLADCHLGFARLNVERFKVEKEKAEADYLEEAKKHLATAKEMIEKMGYHRRDKEVDELEKQLK